MPKHKNIELKMAKNGFILTYDTQKPGIGGGRFEETYDYNEKEVFGLADGLKALERMSELSNIPIGEPEQTTTKLVTAKEE